LRSLAIFYAFIAIVQSSKYNRMIAIALSAYFLSISENLCFVGDSVLEVAKHTINLP